MKVDEGLRKYQDLNREDYFKKNQELAKGLWEKEKLPTVFDIAKYSNGEVSENVNEIFNFFDNKEDFDRMINKETRLYEQDESSNFISKVMASNNKEISDSGYLYKLIMASADDFRITQEECDSKGEEFKVDPDIFTEQFFNFYIKDMFVVEINEFVKCHYDEFEDKYKEVIENNNYLLHVLNPLHCSLHEDHTVCRKCSGILPEGLINIGTFTCLCVTEFATQSALSSMNKGVKKNINQIVSVGYSGKDNWEGIREWIKSNLNDLESSPVEARYYQIVYLSRVRKDRTRTGEEYPFVASLKNSINHSGNLFGAFIFSPNDKNFRNMFDEEEFEDDSLKLKIAMNNFGKHKK